MKSKRILQHIPSPRTLKTSKKSEHSMVYWLNFDAVIFRRDELAPELGAVNRLQPHVEIRYFTTLDASFFNKTSALRQLFQENLSWEFRWVQKIQVVLSTIVLIRNYFLTRKIFVNSQAEKTIVSACQIIQMVLFTIFSEGWCRSTSGKPASIP